jgi:YHS domain-containing protein
MNAADEKNDTCPVSGQKLGSMGDPVVVQYEGREIRLCCAGCVRAFKANPARYLPRTGGKGIAPALGLLLAALALLGACSVSVDESGVPAGHVASAHSAETPPQAAELTPAPAQEATRTDDDYPLDTCVVTGAKLGSMGEPVVIQHEGREVRLCCSNCPKKFKSDPAKYLKKLDEATKAKRQNGAKP